MDDYQDLPARIGDLPPGPDLAAALAGVDPARLRPADLVTLAQAQARMVSHYQGGLLAGLVAIADATTDPFADQPPPRYQWTSEICTVEDLAVAEIAAALALTHPTASVHLHLATQAVRRLPEVHTAMLAGQVDLPKARVLCEAVEDLDDTTAHTVLGRVLPDAARRTTSQLRARLRRLAVKADPGLAERRYRDGVRGRRLSYGPDPDGTWVLGGYGLPADQAAHALTRINTAADVLKDAGDSRNLDQLRADIFLDMLNQRPLPTTGTDPAATTPSGVAAGDGAVAEEPGQGDDTNHSGQPGHVGDPGVDDTPGASGPPSATGSSAGRGGLELTIPLLTLLGLADDPGVLGSWGPVIADVARRYAEDLTYAPWRVSITDETGRVTWHGITRRRPNAADARYVQARDRTCRFPGCRRSARRSDLDHTHEWQHGGPSIPPNLGVLCRKHHRLKSAGKWKVTQISEGVFLWESWLGHTYVVEPEILDEPDLAPD